MNTKLTITVATFFAAATTCCAASAFAQEPTDEAPAESPPSETPPVAAPEPEAPVQRAPQGYGTAQAMPYGYGAHQRGPQEMEYYEGAGVPDGYIVETRIRKGLVIAGAATFGGAYLLTSLGAAIATDTSSNGDAYAPLFIPVAGPFITIRTAEANATGSFGLVMDGLVQTAGLAMLVAGLAAQEEVLVWRGPGYAIRTDVGPSGASLSASF